MCVCASAFVHACSSHLQSQSQRFSSTLFTECYAYTNNKAIFRKYLDWVFYSCCFWRLRCTFQCYWMYHIAVGTNRWNLCNIFLQLFIVMRIYWLLPDDDDDAGVHFYPFQHLVWSLCRVKHNIRKWNPHMLSRSTFFHFESVLPGLEIWTSEREEPPKTHFDFNRALKNSNFTLLTRTMAIKKQIRTFFIGNKNKFSIHNPKISIFDAIASNLRARFIINIKCGNIENKHT